jgi:hypothetical protein
MQLTQPINVHEFLKTGHAKSALDQRMSQFLLKRVQCLDYEPAPSDHCDAGPRECAVLEGSASRVVLDQLWGKIVTEDLAPLAELYRTGADPHVTTVLRLGSGYSLDWHNHLGAGCAASLLIYLFDGENDGEGGDLVLGEVGEDLKTPTETARYEIKSGDAILIGDASHPLMMHKAEKWTGSGSRYLVSFAFNAIDW